MNEDISSIPQKKKQTKFSLTIGIMSFIAIAIMIVAVIYTFTFYFSSLSQETDGWGGLVFALFIPYTLAFFAVTLVLCICLLILSIKILKDKENGVMRTKKLIISTIVFDIFVIVGYLFLAFMISKVDILFLLFAVYLLSFAIFKIVVLSIYRKRKEEYGGNQI